MVLFGNISDIAAGYGSICEYLIGCGTLREFLRKLGRVRKRPFGSPTSPTFVCARARSKPTSSKLEPCLPLRAKSTSWTFGPIRGRLRAFQHLMSQKPAGFASFRRCQLAGEGCGFGLRAFDWCWGWVGLGLWVWLWVWLGMGVWFGCVQSSEIVVWDRWKEHKGVFDQNHSEPNNTIVFLYIHYTTFLGNFNILERNS